MMAGTPNPCQGHCYGCGYPAIDHYRKQMPQTQTFPAEVFYVCPDNGHASRHGTVDRNDGRGRQCTGSHSFTPQEREAFFQQKRAEILQASAPNLLSALRDLCDAIPDETVAADPPLGVWVDRARAVIARAEAR